MNLVIPTRQPTDKIIDRAAKSAKPIVDSYPKSRTKARDRATALRRRAKFRGVKVRCGYMPHDSGYLVFLMKKEDGQ